MTHYEYVPKFLNTHQSNYLFNKLESEIPWRQVKYFKPERGYVVTPRLTWVCGTHNNDYSPIRVREELIIPNKIPSFLNELKEYLEDYLKQTYTHLLLACYRDNNDSITFHSDDEKFLGSNPNIASITVGAARPFILKKKLNNQKEIFNLSHGDLFVMKETCQKDFFHSVPKQKETLTKRYSITFRNASKAGTKNYYTYN